jgi:hypothetical protein
MVTTRIVVGGYIMAVHTSVAAGFQELEIDTLLVINSGIYPLFGLENDQRIGFGDYGN